MAYVPAQWIDEYGYPHPEPHPAQQQAQQALYTELLQDALKGAAAETGKLIVDSLL